MPLDSVHPISIELCFRRTLVGPMGIKRSQDTMLAVPVATCTSRTKCLNLFHMSWHLGCVSGLFKRLLDSATRSIPTDQCGVEELVAPCHGISSEHHAIT